jgi:metal-responsive CopG/Arc/MetJ family transcriptional regulator
MKTAISVDDQLLNEADRAAHEMGLSRSRLVSDALRAYLRARRRDKMVTQLNRVYSGEPDPSEVRLRTRMKAKFRSTIKDRW